MHLFPFSVSGLEMGKSLVLANDTIYPMTEIERSVRSFWKIDSSFLQRRPRRKNVILLPPNTFFSVIGAHFIAHILELSFFLY